MKQILLFIAFLFSGFVSQAQNGSIWEGISNDSVVFDFGPGDSLLRADPGGALSPVGINDTTGMQLWQIGNTVKTGFLPSGASSVRGIMTDTLQPYSVLQDGRFVFVGFSNPYAGMGGAILNFEHRYQTTPGKDGGFVEFSADYGATWKSIFDFRNPYPVMTENFYTSSDVLANGTPAFSGNSNGYIRSRLQFPFAIPLRSYDSTGNKATSADVWVRFRFTSDSTADTLAGWAIRRIVLERDLYPGAVTNTLYADARLSFSPNPSATGIFRLDDAFEITPDQHYEVRNTLGAVVISGKPERTFKLSGLPKGLYWIRIWGKDGSAVGKVLIAE